MLMALNGLLCADVLLRHYSLTHSRTQTCNIRKWKGSYFVNTQLKLLQTIEMFQ